MKDSSISWRSTWGSPMFRVLGFGKRPSVFTARAALHQAIQGVHVAI